nr:uncharacterized mitochondrial protein AtMg00810-like [Tanacetum cinerariifolium]
MKPLPGVHHQSGEVCKLWKALYGLKQAPHAWYEKFSMVSTSPGFVPSHHDFTIFVKCLSVGRILLSLYVDDMIITGDDCDGIELLKAELSHCFDIKDLGLLRYFLGIEVASSPKGYLLSQSKYITDLFDLFETLLFPSASTLDLLAYCDVDWAGDTVTHMGVPITSPTLLYCDNHSSIHIARNMVFHEKTKHIETDCNLTRHHL